MDDEEQAQAKGGDGGLPAWVMTFADLMSLLMCFFVLLLSFSEMDVAKFKQLAGSMKQAFGVQREVKVREIPKGTSVIAKEFSAGKPAPTVLNEVRQITTKDKYQHLAIDAVGTVDGGKGAGKGGSKEGRNPDSLIKDKRTAAKAKAESEAQKKAQKKASQLANALKQEILAANVEIETRGKVIVIRILEKGAFPAGAAELSPDFTPVLARLRKVLSDFQGQITVSGHTDNVPISTSRFRSNWELSTARAVSVAHELMLDGIIPERRFSVNGYADTRPLVSNDFLADRVKNRRVEIEVVHGDPIAKAIDKRKQFELKTENVITQPLPGADSEGFFPAIELEKQLDNNPSSVPKARDFSALPRQNY